MRRGVIAIGCVLAMAAAVPARERPAQAVQTSASSIAVPFDLVNRHVVMKVTVNGRPLSFVLDTGARQAIIALDRAKELGLTLEGSVSSGGAGAGIVTGSLVRGATYDVFGLPHTEEPLALALPLAGLAPGLGQDVDGIFGGAFIEKFVVELDYQTRRITFHHPNKFVYSGAGTSVPIQIDGNGHPTIKAVVTPVGGAPTTESFLFDIGSSGALILHTPFVVAHRLPGPDMKTVASSGTGAGGETGGRTGRVAALQIGPYTLNRPLTMFSEDKAGAMATPLLAGNIGMQIASRFKIFLDYRHNRIIFEPTAHISDPYDRAFSGIVVRTQPPDYHSFVALQVLPDSPALAAGMQKGDVITAFNGTPATSLTLTQVIEMLERPVPYALTIRRGAQTLSVTVTPVPIS